MFNKVCAFCGEPFETKSGTQIYCKRQHYYTCVICATVYPIKDCREYAKTCSKKCGAILRKQTCLNTYGGVAPACSVSVQEKMANTNLNKYGTKAPLQNSKLKDKMKSTNRTKYGVDWVSQSSSVRNKQKETNLKRYGSENPMSNANIQDKVRTTMKQRYGVEFLLQSPEYRQQKSAEYKAKTGYSHHWANPEIQAKSKQTWKAHYGENVERPLQSDVVQEHLQQTNLEKYGFDNPWKSPVVREQIKHTNLLRYGSENPMGNPEVQARLTKTMQNRYGKPYYSQTDAARLSVMTNPERLPYLNEFQADPVTTIDKYFPGTKPTLKELSEFVGTTLDSVRIAIDRADCRDKVAYVYSYMEKEVCDALREIDPNVVIIQNTHKIIAPYELDIYLPEYHIGIECNPTATHNSSVYAFAHIDKDRQPISYKYHQMKTDLCEKQGVFLFHIFGYEWKYRRDIIKSMLRNLLNKNTDKIFARNTYIKEISSVEMSTFLNANHRQGSAQASVRIGLYKKGTDDLVSVMTFGKMRGTMGTSNKEDTSTIWELIRFCNQTNTSVVGGASKLFQYFIKHYTPNAIRSFSDRAHTRGLLYSTLGFSEIRRSSPSYVWVDYKSDIPYHRVNAQKHNLKQFLKDDNIDLNQTERQIMETHGFVQIYDSGTITWQWKQS